jgi:hypothetical protein
MIQSIKPSENSNNKLHKVELGRELPSINHEDYSSTKQSKPASKSQKISIDDTRNKLEESKVNSHKLEKLWFTVF